MENIRSQEMSQGVPSVFDGAGDIEKMVSHVELENLQEAVDNSKVSNAAVAGKMEAIDYAELMRKLKTKPVVRDFKKIGRNDKCPCGSGKKYKNCCLASGKYETTHQLN